MNKFIWGSGEPIENLDIEILANLASCADKQVPQRLKLNQQINGIQIRKASTSLPLINSLKFMVLFLCQIDMVAMGNFHLQWARESAMASHLIFRCIRTTHLK
jgi:hypothetical protein